MSEVESAIQKRIIGYLRGYDSTYVVNIGGGASTAKGTPDILACHRGRFIALEVKRSDGDYGLTVPQKMRLTTIKACGGVTGVVRSLADVVVIIAQIDEEERCY